jgi:hypothetical protein
MSLNGVYTIAEASEEFNINRNTIKKAIIGDKNNPPIFWRSEARKSAGTWLVIKEGMERVFVEKDGREQLPKERQDIMMLGYYDGLYLRNNLKEDRLAFYHKRIREITDIERETDGIELISVLMELDKEAGDDKIKVSLGYLLNPKEFRVSISTMLMGMKGQEFFYNVD